MLSPIMAACDDCGVETDQADMYDSPWADNKLRCMDCFLKFCGFDLDVINEWVASMADLVRQQLAEMSHEKATQQAGVTDPHPAVEDGEDSNSAGG